MKRKREGQRQVGREGCRMTAEHLPFSSSTKRWDRLGHTNPSAAQEWGPEVPASDCWCSGQRARACRAQAIGISSSAFPEAQLEQHLAQGVQAQMSQHSRPMVITEVYQVVQGPDVLGMEWAGSHVLRVA